MTTKVNAQAVLKTAALIKKISYTIAGVATLASYGTQVVLLLAHNVGLFSYAIPATIDLLAIACTMALMFQEIDTSTKRMAGGFLVIAVTVSIVANVMGADNAVAAIGHAWPVLAYLLAEMLASRVRAFAARIQAAEDAKNAPRPVVAIPVTTPQVATPLPTATVRTRKAPSAATVRATGSHANCGHPATPKDRAACRAGR